MTAPLRLCLLAMAAGVTACSSGPDAVPEVAEGDDHIACALGGAEQFERICAVERAQQDGALYLVVRHPGGAFRRFEVLQDGRGLALADGAEAAEIVLDGEMLDVAVGSDRYRFPATQKSHAANP